MKYKKNTGIKRIIYAARYSWSGLTAAWKNEAAFRQEVVALIAAVIIALLIDVSLFQKVALVGSVVFVMIVELMNSAVEAVVDRIGLERHELSGQRKRPRLCRCVSGNWFSTYDLGIHILVAFHRLIPPQPSNF